MATKPVPKLETAAFTYYCLLTAITYLPLWIPRGYLVVGSSIFLIRNSKKAPMEFVKYLKRTESDLMLDAEVNVPGYGFGIAMSGV